MNKKILYTFVISTALILGAGCSKRSPEARLDHMANHLASHLDFNDQQKALLKDLTDFIKADIKEHEADSKSLKEEILKQVRGPELDTTKVKQMLAEHQASMQKNTDKYLPKVAALHKTMNEKQKNELASMIDKLFAHF